MTEGEAFIFFAVLLALTFGVLRVAFCRVAKHTAHLLEKGWRDFWL